LPHCTAQKCAQALLSATAEADTVLGSLVRLH